MDAESPKLAFKALGFLDDKTARGVKEMADTDLVRDIVGGSMAVVHEELALADQKAILKEIEDDEEIPKPAKKVVAETVEEEAPKKKVVAAKKKPVIEEEEFDLDGINFDD
jgi:hypothetical protein